MPINLIKKLETDLHVDKLSFIWSPYEKDLISYLNSFAKGKCATVMHDFRQETVTFDYGLVENTGN